MLKVLPSPNCWSPSPARSCRAERIGSSLVDAMRVLAALRPQPVIEIFRTDRSGRDRRSSSAGSAGRRRRKRPAGAAKNIDLGTLGNTIAGAVGGGVGGQILGMLLPLLANSASTPDIGSIDRPGGRRRRCRCRSHRDRRRHQERSQRLDRNGVSVNLYVRTPRCRCIAELGVPCTIASDVWRQEA